MLLDKSKADGYDISSKYAQEMLVTHKWKFVSALTTLKADIDKRAFQIALDTK